MRTKRHLQKFGLISLFTMLVLAFAPKIAYGEQFVYRLYNWRTSEHLYTTNKKEYDTLPTQTKGDWEREGVAWIAPDSSSTPVYRLYNKGLGDHHYTASENERDTLIKKYGWNDEKIAFYSDDAHTIAIFRVYNGRLKRGQHHYTTNHGEARDLIKRYGWKDEGIAFYAVDDGDDVDVDVDVPTNTYYKGGGQELYLERGGRFTWTDSTGSPVARSYGRFVSGVEGNPTKNDKPKSSDSDYISSITLYYDNGAVDWLFYYDKDGRQYLLDPDVELALFRS